MYQSANKRAALGSINPPWMGLCANKSMATRLHTGAPSRWCVGTCLLADCSGVCKLCSCNPPRAGGLPPAGGPAGSQLTGGGPSASVPSQCPLQSAEEGRGYPASQQAGAPTTPCPPGQWISASPWNDVSAIHHRSSMASLCKEQTQQLATLLLNMRILYLACHGCHCRPAEATHSKAVHLRLCLLKVLSGGLTPHAP